MARRRIPLFPLGLALLPGMPLPLHIFEERYKEMISVCLTEDRAFGVVLFDGKALHAVGCTARIVEVLRRYPDGRMDVRTLGEDRFLLHEVVEERAYMEGEVSPIGDFGGGSRGGLEASMERAHRILLELGEADPSVEGMEEMLAADAETLSFSIPAMDGFTPAERQRFLEMRSLPERLDKAVSALEKHVARLQINRQILGIIGKNGRLPEDLRRRLDDLS